MRFIANPAIGDLWDFLTNIWCVKEDYRSTAIPYRNGKDWIAIPADELGWSQKAELPTAGTNNIGAIYQYIGPTTAEFKNGYFYRSATDWTNYYWEEVIFGPSTNEAILQDSITSNITIGWIEADSLFAAGTPLEDIFRKLLVKYFEPTVSLTISPSTTPLVKGTTINSIVLSANVGKRSNPITSVRFYANNVLIHESTNSSEGGTIAYTYSPSNPIDDDIILKVVVSDSISTIEDSKSIDFVDSSFFGSVAEDVTTPTADIITGLDSIALVSKKYTRSWINMTYGKILYAYPASYGNLTSIKDGNNFEYINSYTKSTVTIDGIVYNVYLLTEAAGVSDFKQVYA